MRAQWEDGWIFFRVGYISLPLEPSFLDSADWPKDEKSSFRSGSLLCSLFHFIVLNNMFHNVNPKNLSCLFICDVLPLIF